MSAESYLMAWIWYLSGSVILLAVGWWLSRAWPLLIRLPVRAVLAAAMLVPARVSGDHSELAPAWLVLLFDSMVQGDLEPLRAAKPLLIFSIVALLVAILSLWLHYRRGAKVAAQAQLAE